MGETVVAAATVPKCCSLQGPTRLLFGRGDQGSCCWELEASWDRRLLLDNSLDSALPDNEESDISTDCKRESFKGLPWTWLPGSCRREKAGSRQGNNSAEFN